VNNSLQVENVQNDKRFVDVLFVPMLCCSVLRSATTTATRVQGTDCNGVNVCRDTMVTRLVGAAGQNDLLHTRRVTTVSIPRVCRLLFIIIIFNLLTDGIRPS
jgi:hypothetical protein